MTRLESIQRVVAAYKVVLGMQRGTPRWDAWNKHNYARNTKAAASVLDAFDGKTEMAVAWVIFKGNEWRDAELSFTLETIARHGWDNGGAFSGQQDGEMGADSVLGYSSGGGLAQAGGQEPKRLDADVRPHIPAESPEVPSKSVLGPQNTTGRPGAENGRFFPPDLSDLGKDHE